MTGADLKLSGTRQDFDTTTGEPIVTMQFTGEGADKFGEITDEEADRGKLLTNTVGGGQEIFQHFAIVLDREIKSWPQIDWKQYPNGISGSNGAQITGIGDLQEAFRRTLDGERHCPVSVDVTHFLCEAMRSIASGERRKVGRRPASMPPWPRSGRNSSASSRGCGTSTR